jgi:hypothetical protein
LLLGSDQQYYQVTLVPENYETEVALLLVYLSSGLQEQVHTVFRQQLWGLALLKTLQEGLDQLDGGDAHWDPEAALARIFHVLEREMHTEEEALRVALRRSLDHLARCMDVEIALALLKTLATKKALAGFEAFLTQEWGGNVPNTGYPTPIWSMSGRKNGVTL